MIFINMDCHCSKCIRESMFDNLKKKLDELNANAMQFEEIKESINKILDGRNNGFGRQNQENA